MTIKRIWVDNYRDFRSTFDKDADAEYVLSNLQQEARRQVSDGLCSHVDLFLTPSYDDEGIAIFEVRTVKVLPDRSIIINVEYTGTAK